MRVRRPWILRLPRGLREQPAWVFIGILVGFAGLSYLFGYTESSVAKAIPQIGLQIWGFLLTFSGFGVVLAVLRSRPALEKFALRVLSVCLLVYMGWLTTVVDFRRLVLSVVLTLALVVLAEIRIAVIKMLLQGRHIW